MLQSRLYPESGVLKYMILLATVVQWIWDYLLPESTSEYQQMGYSNNVDDLVVTRYKKRNGGDSSEECVVCLWRIDEGDEVRELSCHHLYHKACLDRWVRYGYRTCPLCRSSLKSPQSAAQHHYPATTAVKIENEES